MREWGGGGEGEEVREVGGGEKGGGEKGGGEGGGRRGRGEGR